jgi:SAM-dependent methyltransferase
VTPRLPRSASVAEPREGARLHAPAAARNLVPLTELLLAHAPREGTALELASGTGQHVASFAAALPGLAWTPSEIDPARRASIDAHVAEARLTNVVEAAFLDAARPGWGAEQYPRDLVVLINLLHLIPMESVRTVILEAAEALAPGGTLVIYGPFRRGGQLTSEGDRRFDAELRAADATNGYKDDVDIATMLSDAALSPIDMAEMPANNLAFIAGKPRT